MTLKKLYLKYNEFVPVGETLKSGQIVRVNHNTAECQGSSKSMKVEKKDDGSISAKCYRCGCSGYYGNKFALKSKASGGTDRGNGDRSNRDNVTIPSDAETTLGTWSSKRAALWIRQYGITEEECSEYGICYSPSVGRVLLPVWDKDGTLAQYQARAVQDGETPKYLTHFHHDTAMLCGGTADTVVLVEDMLSAIKVARHYPAMPLFSTNVRDTHLKHLISKGFTKFVIWLDDDNLQVKREQLRNKRRLDKFGKAYIVHTDGRDPKEHSDQEIIDIIKDTIND